MRKLLALVALTCTVAISAAAQTPSDVYQMSPYTTASFQNEFVQIVNPGLQGTPLSADQGTICADIYVFDEHQEMVSCCNCPVTANELLTLAVSVPGSSISLLSSPLTGVVPFQGVVKVVSDLGSNCNASNPQPVPNLRVWMLDHAIVPGFVDDRAFINSREQFAASALSAGEQAFLGQACSFVRYLGSGRGNCSCLKFLP